MRYFNLYINERGYAFIEVVLLIAVIAILSAAVIPKIGNGMKIAQADYLMKSLYGDLRFMQTAKRITSYKKEEIMVVNKSTSSLVAISSNEKKQYRIRFGDTEELRKYKLPANLSFKKNFSIQMSIEGILSNANSNNEHSGSIILTDNLNKQYKPFIVFDSVGRIRFSNSSSDF